MLRKWLGLGAAGFAGAGVVMAGLGLAMGQVATGNRQLVGWLGAAMFATVCGVAAWQLLQHRNDPPSANAQVRQRAVKDRNIRGACALGGLLVTWAFIWTATTAQGEFEQTLEAIFKWGVGFFLLGAGLGGIREKYTKGKDKK